MTGSSIASIITAAGTFCTAGALVITAIAGLRRSKETRAAIHQVQVIVDGSKTNLENYQRALMRALNDAGVDIPVDQSAE